MVVERDQAGPSGGYGIDVAGTGYDVAGRMGILDQFAARPLRSDSIAHIDADNRVTARLDRPLAEKKLRGPYLALMHTALEEALLDAIQGKVELRHQRSVTEVRHNDSRVQATFTNGTQASFDLAAWSQPRVPPTACSAC